MTIEELEQELPELNTMLERYARVAQQHLDEDNIMEAVCRGKILQYVKSLIMKEDGDRG